MANPLGTKDETTIKIVHSPDYANCVYPLSAELKTGTFTYVAPSDGILYITPVASNLRVFFAINVQAAGAQSSVRIASFAIDNPGSNSQKTFTILLSKNDTVTTTELSQNLFITNNSTCFVPFKTTV